MLTEFILGKKINSFIEKSLVDACYDEDMIAQSTCGGISQREGHVFAVRKPCPGKENCEQICGSNELKAQDSQANKQTYVCQKNKIRKLNSRI